MVKLGLGFWGAGLAFGDCERNQDRSSNDERHGRKDGDICGVVHF
jgi:hypothetical protein